MTSDELKQLESQFYTYTNGFVEKATNPEPYLLKQAHSERVCDNINRLSDSLGLGVSERTLARATALLHDIGRFPQFKNYDTFSDPMSKNHAALGVGVLVTQGITDSLSMSERRLILRTVALHNRPTLPSKLSTGLLKLARLLRDADKIDIFKVMTDLYRGRHDNKQNYITHDLRDDKIIPHALVDQIIAGRPIHYSQVKTLNGIKLFQLSMIFDLNFSAAFEMIKEKDVVRIITGSMPGSPRLDVLERVLDRYMDNKIKKIKG